MSKLDALAVEAQTDSSAKAKLVEHPEVRAAIRNAVHHVTKTGSNLPKEDLYQEGFIALLEALPGYDPSKGKFTTYIYSKVRGHVVDTAGEHYHGLSVPRKAVDRYRHAIAQTETLADAREAAAGVLAGETFDAVHAAVMGVSHFSRLQDDADSFDTPDQSTPFPVSVVNRQAVHAELAKLPDRERDVLEMAYGFRGEPMSDGAIADAYCLPRQNVQRIRTRAMARLAHNLEESQR